MIIDEDLLLDSGGSYETYLAKDTIFKIGEQANYYIQIVEGIVEINNYHENGKEVTLNILTDGQAISEFLLSSGNKYLMNAVARTDCKIIKLAKCNLMKLLKKNNGVVFDLFRCLSDRLSHEYVMLFNNSSNDSLHKVRSLLDYYKKSSTNLDRYSYCVPLTRQQMANLSGMRVETIIRTVKKMEKSNIIQIKGGKIFY